MVKLSFEIPITAPPEQLDAADGVSLRLGHGIGQRSRTIVLAHGFGQTRQAWTGTQSRLRDAGWPSLSWDARGHGESGRNPDHTPYRARQFVSDVAQVAGIAGTAPVLVGASMGGLTGLAAQAQARCFSALVLVDIAPRWEAAGVARILEFMGAHPDGFDSFGQAAERISTYLPQRRQQKTPAQLRHLLRPRADGRLVWHWDPRLLAEFIPDTEGLSAELEAAARTLDVPVLLISGGRSDLIGQAQVDHFLALVPHARHVRLPDATHMLAGDDNDTFTDTLLSFLSDPAAPAALAPPCATTVTVATTPGATS